MAMFSRRLSLESLENRRLLAGLAVPGSLEDCSGATPNEVTSSIVAVTAENLSGLRAAEMQISFEPGDMGVAAASVKAGAAWQGKANIVSKVDEVAGTINVFVFSANPITTSSGELLEVEFDVVDEIAHDVSNHIELTLFELNEGEIASPPKLLFETSSVESPPPSELTLVRELTLPSVAPAQPVAELAPQFPPQQASAVVPHATEKPHEVPRIQPRLLSIPAVGPVAVQLPVAPPFGQSQLGYFSDGDWTSIVSRQRWRTT